VVKQVSGIMEGVKVQLGVAPSFETNG
jgi:hypothetical protein